MLKHRTVGYADEVPCEWLTRDSARFGRSYQTPLVQIVSFNRDEETPVLVGVFPQYEFSRIVTAFKI